MAEMILTVESMSYRGLGIGKYDGKAYFLPKCVAGDVVRAEAADRDDPRNHTAFCREILKPSEWRSDFPCKYAMRCPACHLCFLDDKKQLQHKVERQNALFSKITRSEIQAEAMPAKARFAFRNRCALNYRGNVLGIDDIESHTRIPMADCPLHTTFLNRCIARTEDLLRQTNCRDDAMFGIDIETGIDDGVRIIVTGAPDFADEHEKLAVCIAENTSFDVFLRILPPRSSHVFPPLRLIKGKKELKYDRADNRDLMALPNAWIPASYGNAQMVRQCISEYLSSLRFERIVEIGCGCGTHAFDLLRLGKSYLGIDASREAVESAAINASGLLGENFAFRQGESIRALKKLILKGDKADLCVFHASRMPYPKQAIDYAKMLGAKYLLFVSPTAYATATAVARSEGYRPVRLKILDTMPHSYHAMSMALCERK